MGSPGGDSPAQADTRFREARLPKPAPPNPRYLTITNTKSIDSRPPKDPAVRLPCKMAGIHGHHDAASEYQRGEFGIRWLTLHAGNMSDVQIQGRRESRGFQSNRASGFSAAA